MRPIKKKKGRPRVLEGHIAFNVKLPAELWAELRAIADKEDKPMSDVAREALGEWLLATKLGQRPISAGRPAKIIGEL